MSLQARLAALITAIGGDIKALMTGKQDTLVSGSNIKTVNGHSLLGSGDLPISAGSAILPMVVVSNSTQAASANTQYVLTGAAATTVTLPGTPADGDVVSVAPINGRLDNVISRNGKNIQGLAEDLVLNVAVPSVELRYINDTMQWRII